MVGSAAALPAGLAATVFGYLVGNGLPAPVRKVVHPIITCGLVGNLGVALQGAMAGSGYEESVRAYLTKVRKKDMGACGDRLTTMCSMVACA